MSDQGRAAREAHEAIDRAMSAAHYTHTDAREAHCWFDVDRVAEDPATTAWKRLARWRQACWRDAHDYPIGFDPYGGGLRAKRVGSRLALDFARSTGANFLAPQVLAAMRARLEQREPNQALDADLLWADLLASLPLCFNVFGSLYGHPELAQRAVRAWWPEFVGSSVAVRFGYSPGWRDSAFLGDQTAFDAAFEIETKGGLAIVGVAVKYHEHPGAAAPPESEALARYVAVAERSDVFHAGWQHAAIGTSLQRVWIDHLLLLSMLQHGSQRWQRGRLVLVYPALNPSFATAARRYRELLRDPATFEAISLEELLRAPAAIERSLRDAIQARYL